MWNGFDFGRTLKERVIEDAETVVGHEKKRIQLANEPETTRCRARLQLLYEERVTLRAVLRRSATDPNVGRSWWVGIAVVLVIASVCLNHIALEPFGLGWPSWPLAIAMGVLCIAAGDKVLDRYGDARFIGIAALMAFGAAMCASISLSRMRADLVWLYMKAALSTGSLSGVSAADATRFYELAVPRLRWIFPCFTAAAEITTTLVIWQMKQHAPVEADVRRSAERRLAEIEPEMAALAERITFLENEPEVFEHEFWRDFHIGLAASSRAAMPLLRTVGKAVGVVILGAVLEPRAMFGQPITVPVADVTRSTAAARSADGTTEYGKNMDAIATLLSHLTASTRYTVIGITDSSYSKPLFLGSGQIAGDIGPLPLLSRIEMTRGSAAAQFRQAATALRVSAQKSDIIGAFFVAAEIFRNANASPRTLVVFSDLRHSAPPLDIETPKVIAVSSALRIAESHRLIPDLRGVDVYLLGVDAAGKDVAYMRTLQQFWTAFIARSGARLKSFSMLRDIPDLKQSK